MREGGVGSKPQYNRVYTEDPLTHLLSSHLLEPPERRISTFAALGRPGSTALRGPHRMLRGALLEGVYIGLKQGLCRAYRGLYKVYRCYIRFRVEELHGTHFFAKT